MNKVASILRNFLAFLYLACLDNRKIADPDLLCLKVGTKVYFSERCLCHSNVHANIEKILSNTVFVDSLFKSDCIAVWGKSFRKWRFFPVMYAFFLKKPIYIFEDGFVRSFNLAVSGEPGLSITFDSVGVYYDSKATSSGELILNSAFELTHEQEEYVDTSIKLLVENKISKYNFSPLKDVFLGHKDKVLVVDQKKGDLSIPYSSASDCTFYEMLNAAIVENPNSDIIVKTHPDGNTQNYEGYFSSIENTDRVRVLKEDVNPFDVLHSIKKVYVVSSQLGFEALFLGKKVVCFGVPFYSNWGLTDDRVRCARRRKVRSLNDVFYVYYVKLSFYSDGFSSSQLEGTVNTLINVRREFFRR